jgi:hypothetical protein
MRSPSLDVVEATSFLPRSPSVWMAPVPSLVMDSLELRARIRKKLDDGRLPRDAKVRPWRDAVRPDHCDACDEPVTASDSDVEIAVASGPKHFLHSECMYVWYLERTGPLTGDPGRPAP